MSTPVFRYPKDYIGIVRGFSNTHRGVDLGWSAASGGCNMPLLAPADGTVIIAVTSVEDNPAGVNNGGDWGNSVMLDHGGGWYTRSAHMKQNSVCVGIGQRVKRADKIGLMGNSGNSNGWHDHYEVYFGGTSTKYRVDPMKYTRVWPDQTVSPCTSLAAKLLYMSHGMPVARNEAVDQIEVLTEYLYARDGANGNKLGGYMAKGVYNALAVQSAGGYDWAMVEEGVWCACGEGLATFLPGTKRGSGGLRMLAESLRNENDGLRVKNAWLEKKIESAKKALGEE